LAKKKGFNDYIVCDDHAEFIIINRKEIEFRVSVDFDDLQRLINLDIRWFTIWHKDSRTYYVRCSHKKEDDLLYLHDFIMNPSADQLVDHEDHNGINNRRNNLRLVDKQSNCRHRKGANKNNTSGYRNVSFDSKSNPIVQLQDKNGKNHIWRDFKDVHEAGAFAEQKRKEWYGKFAGQ
jgi:hypothetical protein